MHFNGPAFSWTHAEPHEAVLDFYDNHLKPWKRRWRCKKCGSNVASYNSRTEKWSVWGAEMARDEFGSIRSWEVAKPSAHIFYGTRMLNVNDDLPKWEGYEGTSRRLD